MAQFAYEAFTGDGRIVRGEIAARSQSEALQQLRTQGLIAFTAAANSRLHKPKFWRAEFSRCKNIPATARLALIYELGVLLRAQLPLDQALRLLPDQPDLKKISPLIRSIHELVTAGKTLGEAMMAHPEAIPEQDAAMVRAAEHSGSIAELLLQMAASMRRQLELRARLTSALTYPAILLIMSVFTVAVIAAVLVPNLLPLFEGAGTQVPFVIRLLARLHAQFYLLAGASTIFLVLALAVAHRMRNNDQVRLLWDRMLLRLPIVGSLVAASEAARTGCSLGLLLKSGMPLLQAISLVQKVTRNGAVRAALAGSAEQIASGGRVGRAFAQHAVMPAAACHLAAIGEESNRLDEMMAHVAQMYEAALQQKIERIMTLVTPLMTLAMGLLVAGLIFSVMQAFLSVNDLFLE
jgi:general secretion pathway protein F